jgi:hypothetical protein
MELNCPECDSRLALVPFPTEDQLRAAAEAGNAQAVEDLAARDADGPRREAWSRDWQASRDRLPSLPDLAGEALTFSLHAEGRDWMNPDWLLILHEGQEIYREPSGFEHWAAVIELAEAIQDRYGDRVLWFDPGEAAVGLLGDDLSAAKKISSFLTRTGLTPPSGRWKAQTT